MLTMAWWITFVLVAVIVCLVVYRKRNFGRCVSKVDLTGKTVIVTGSNTGIGYYTALDLARRNARVILACRNRERADAACAQMRMESRNTNIVVELLDLSSMKSVRSFADRIKKTESRLDILVNNAGLLGLPKRITEDGLESMFATNHFGPFLLTNLLLDLMKKTGRARIVNVSSLVNKFGKINFDNLCAEKSFSRYTIYSDTKLANVLFTKELARRLEGTDVTTNCLHPGTIRTELLRTIPTPIRQLIQPIGWIFYKSPEEGAQTSLHLALSEEVEGVSGHYFSECRDAEKAVNPVSHDRAIATKLWDVSERLTGLA